ncbi:MAG: Hpt domain-containing protein [Ruminococcus sp.]|nr:Hpt domain-containing protein [Ruminococcus sp.]
MNSDILKNGGIDYDHGVERFMNNVPVYERLLKNFPNDNLYEQAFEEYERRDYDALFKSLHTMKSSTGTLDLTELYSATDELVEALRISDLSNVDKLMEIIKVAYKRAVEAIGNA